MWHVQCHVVRSHRSFCAIIKCLKGLLRVPEAHFFMFLGIEIEEVCAALSAVLYLSADNSGASIREGLARLWPRTEEALDPGRRICK